MSHPLLIIVATIITISYAGNRGESPHPILIYEDMKCTAEATEHGVISYKCDDGKLSNNTCLFQSKHYNVGESVPQELTYGACQVGCICRPQLDKQADFTCAILDCPEIFTPPLNHSCYHTYKPGECCSSGTICEDMDDTQVTCEIDGVIHRKGQRFNPKGTCMDCVCLEGFNHILKEPFCKQRICAAQIRNSKQLAQHCAPLYHFDKTFCCPDDWVCSNGTEQFIHSKNETPYKCQFGDNFVPHGAKFDTTHSQWGKTIETTCECIVPPLLTCYNKQK